VRLSERVSGLADVQAVVEDPAEHLVSTDRALRLMERLSPRDAEVLRLAAWEQLDIPEIAYVLGCTPSAARVRLHRARRRAEQLLAAADHDPDDGTAAPAPTRPTFVTLAEEPT
jgi:RNA polymerase sigma-70 factor (ECF subfamily)